MITMKRLPVVAAIPNYNMGESLKTLLPDVVQQGYDEVYILDDASNDDSRDVTERLGAHFVSSAENLGAGGNRNRIISALGGEAIIHFLDADMTIHDDRMAERVREISPSETFGFVGGLITDLSGRQMAYNFGPRQSLRNDLAGLVHLGLHTLGNKRPALEACMRQRFAKTLRGWPNTSEEPRRQDVFWSAEANLVVNSQVFTEIGGFDASLRNHEIQDLAIRMSKAGLKRSFDPLLAATHTAAEVRDGNRNAAFIRAEATIALKHGVLDWITAR